jgi:hypothetical protein
VPFQSQAQRGKFYAMAASGEMPKATVEKWEKETPRDAKLPKYKESKLNAMKKKASDYA